MISDGEKSLEKIKLLRTLFRAFKTLVIISVYLFVVTATYTHYFERKVGD